MRVDATKDLAKTMVSIIFDLWYLGLFDSFLEQNKIDYQTGVHEHVILD